MFASKYVYDFATWAKGQPGVELSHAIIQNVDDASGSRWSRAITTLRTRGLRVFLANLGFALIQRAERQLLRRSRIHSDHYASFDLGKLGLARLDVKPVVSPSGLVHRFEADDLKQIKSLDLDLLIRCGSGILRGEILTAARFGVLSFHHGDNRVNRGGPAGFWEVFHGLPHTGFIIQQLTEELDGGRVLSRGSFPTQFYFLLNQATLFHRSNYYLKHLVSRIAETRSLPPCEPPMPYGGALYVQPRLGEQVRYATAIGTSIIKRSARKISGRAPRWGAAFLRSGWEGAVMRRGIRLPMMPYTFIADPFVHSNEQGDFCFVEEFDYRTNRAHISVYKLHEKKAEYLDKVIVEPFHMSFPFLLENGSKLYMVPETSEAREIRLYECVSFPLKWELRHIIMRDVAAVDTMLFQRNGKWWMLTNVDHGNVEDHCSSLSVYSAPDLFSSCWTPHPSNPVIVDASSARNGGLLTDGEGNTYRVSQNQGFDAYGKAFAINRIVELSDTAYREHRQTEISPSFFPGLEGTHHMHSNNRITVFDFVSLDTVKSAR
jgi:hypothetical protein